MPTGSLEESGNARSIAKQHLERLVITKKLILFIVHAIVCRSEGREAVLQLDNILNAIGMNK